MELRFSSLLQMVQSGKILSITSDSKKVTPGALFVAIRGVNQDGHRYISQVLRSGAVGIVGEEPSREYRNAFYIQVKDSRKALAYLAAEFYKNPSHTMKVIGVTGTSGKTTITYLMESILKKAGYKVGVIGTINTRFGRKILASDLTTPGPLELQKTVSEMKKASCNAVVMEVSSHALKQSRAAFMAYDAMVFTNLSPEHQDYHLSMQDYFESKAILFREGLKVSLMANKKPVLVVNRDDPYGKKLMRTLPRSDYCYGLKNWRKLDLSFYGTNGVVKIGKGPLMSIRSPLLGEFNALNILAAVSVAKGLGIKDQLIRDGVWALKSIPGRLEKVPHSHQRHILIDYAHKPQALQKVLELLAHMKKQGKLITVFGCGGDRDRKKRPIMGKTAVSLSDDVIVTSDNPRTETPEKIIKEILVGMRGYSNYSVEPDRKTAIFRAISQSQKGDIVLIAGKGHEEYQILKRGKIHFSDREIVREALKNFLGQRI